VLWGRDLWWLIVFTVTVQGFVPLAAFVWLALGAPHRTLMISRILLVASFLLLIALAGVWLWLPWWTIVVWAGLFALASVCGWWRTRRVAVDAPLPTGIGGAVVGALTIGLLLLAGYAWSGRQPPGRGRAEFEFPLAAGDYLVIDGGRNGLVNSQVPIWAADRGDDSRGIAVVRVDHEGMRARALLPSKLTRYMSWGDVVYAPCSGHVLEAEDELPDQAPGAIDERSPAGNHLVLRCGPYDVKLEHLQQGSVGVRRGARVLAKDPVARVGNSGRAGEPHLRFYAWNHAMQPSSERSRAVTLTFGGRVLTRGDRVRQTRVEAPTVAGPRHQPPRAAPATRPGRESSESAQRTTVDCTASPGPFCAPG